MSTSVEASLNYFCPPADGSRPWRSLAQDVAGNRERNWEEVSKTVQIESIRGKESEYSLDTSGFTIGIKPAKHTSFDDDEKVKAEYYPDSIELIKELTGASQVFLFDHTIRRNNNLPDTPENRHPVPLVHVDQTDKAAEARVRRHMPESDVERLLKNRYQILNLWRPIGHPAFDFPLAFCDYRSVDKDNDFQPTTLVYPNPPHGEIMSVKYNADHKWKYVRGMDPDEFVLIKCFDTQRDAARFVPHTAFTDPSTPGDAPPRQSIELRALVFYD